MTGILARPLAVVETDVAQLLLQCEHRAEIGSESDTNEIAAEQEEEENTDDRRFRFPLP